LEPATGAAQAVRDGFNPSCEPLRFADRRDSRCAYATREGGHPGRLRPPGRLTTDHCGWDELDRGRGPGNCADGIAARFSVRRSGTAALLVGSAR
jgi:hypothetical protein